MGLLLFALYAASHYGTSAPILRSRQDQVSSWHSEPNGRGTWGLLNSCVITMAICVWSAVHLNVPGRRPKGEWQPLSFWEWRFLSTQEKLDRWDPWSHHLRRTRWTLMGLLAPELVVYCAWIQWSNARELSRSIARANYPRKHPWTLAHSFFAGMGGFAFDSGDFVPGQDYLYLTTAGVEQVVELGHPLPDLRKEAIFDKSKADSLGKILVCLQAGYMIFQVTGRLVARLPITLLEVNTLGHVLCALTMYAFWFHKPLGVSDPVVLSEDWAKPFSCLWFMKGHRHYIFRALSKPPNPNIMRETELDLLKYFLYSDHRKQVEKQSWGKPRDPGCALQACMELKLPLQAHERSDRAASEDATETEDIKFGPNTAVRAHPIIQHGLPKDLEGLADHRILFYKRSEPSEVSSDEEIMQRLASSKLWDGLIHVYHFNEQDQFEAWWERWCEQVALYGCADNCLNKKPVSPFKNNGISAFIPQHIFLDSAGLRRWELAHQVLELDLHFKQGVTEVRRRLSNWPDSRSGLLSDERTPIVTMAVVTALYGALHALCWHSHFPSVAEKMLWRTSSIVIAAGPVTIFAIFYGVELIGDWLNDGIVNDTWTFLGITALSLCALVYVSARLFILLEAFISVRSLPEGAYQTPSWTAWLPHL